MILRDVENLPAEEVARLNCGKGDGSFAHRQCADEIQKVPGEEETVMKHPAPRYWRCTHAGIWTCGLWCGQACMCIAASSAGEVRAVQRAIAVLKSDALKMPDTGLGRDGRGDARQHPVGADGRRDCGRATGAK